MSGTPAIFDHKLLRERRRRAAALGAEPFLLDRVAGELAERLSVVLRQFDRAADIGTSGDVLRRALAKSVDSIDAIEIGDEESLALAESSLTLVGSALALQYSNDLPGVLVQVRRALKPDGLFLAALAGGETLTELR